MLINAITIICMFSLLLSILGILISQNVLQASHFITIIEIISVPCAIIIAILLHKTDAIKLIIYAFTIPIISPISSYFIGKLYLLQNDSK